MHATKEILPKHNTFHSPFFCPFVRLTKRENLGNTSDCRETLYFFRTKSQASARDYARYSCPPLVLIQRDICLTARCLTSSTHKAPQNTAKTDESDSHAMDFGRTQYVCSRLDITKYCTLLRRCCKPHYLVEVSVANIGA